MLEQNPQKGGFRSGTTYQALGGRYMSLTKTNLITKLKERVSISYGLRSCYMGVRI